MGNGISTEALAAVNMAFPFIMVISASISLISIGGCVTAAILIGQKKEKKRDYFLFQKKEKRKNKIKRI